MLPINSAVAPESYSANQNKRQALSWAPTPAPALPLALALVLAPALGLGLSVLLYILALGHSLLPRRGNCLAQYPIVHEVIDVRCRIGFGQHIVLGSQAELPRVGYHNEYAFHLFANRVVCIELESLRALHRHTIYHD